MCCTGEGKPNPNTQLLRISTKPAKIKPKAEGTPSDASKILHGTKVPRRTWSDYIARCQGKIGRFAEGFTFPRRKQNR
jgi:hypothetical protein